jgi:hypothetical protein
LTGTPSALGTSGFSVMVKDANGKTATGTFGITTVASSGYDGPAQLPLVTVATAMADTPAPGAVINVNAGGDLQSALNSAQCGETIQLQAGATFNGSFTLPAKNCDNNHWIIVRTSSPDSALPAEGQRVTPCYGGVSSLEGRPAYNCPNPQNVLAKVQMPNPDGGPFSLANGANFYRLVGLELTRPIGVKGSAVLISIEDKGDVRGTADHIIVDRSWLHGQGRCLRDPFFIEKTGQQSQFLLRETTAPERFLTHDFRHRFSLGMRTAGMQTARHFFFRHPFDSLQDARSFFSQAWPCFVRDHICGQRLDGRGFEQHDRRQIHPKHIAQPRNDLRGQYGIAP